MVRGHLSVNEVVTLPFTADLVLGKNSDQNLQSYI